MPTDAPSSAPPNKLRRRISRSETSCWRSCRDASLPRLVCQRGSYLSLTNAQVFSGDRANPRPETTDVRERVIVVPNNLVRGQMSVALRCVRVLYQDHRVAKRQRPTSGCVHTKLRMHSADYKVANSM